MKKVIISITSILFSLLLVSCSSNENENLKRQKELRKGYTKMVVYAFSYRFGELVKPGTQLEAYGFYEDGNISAEVKKDEKTDEVYTIFYEYNKANMFTEIQQMDIYPKYRERLEYYEGDTILAKRYGETFNKITSSFMDDILTVYDHKCEYDDKGNEIYYENHDRTDKYYWEQSTTENIYNDKGELIQTTKIQKSFDNIIFGNIKDVVKYRTDTIITKYENGTGYIIKKDGNKEPSRAREWDHGIKYDETKLFPPASDLVKYTYNKDGLIIDKTVFNEKKEPIAFFRFDYQ